MCRYAGVQLECPFGSCLAHCLGHCNSGVDIVYIYYCKRISQSGVYAGGSSVSTVPSVLQPRGMPAKATPQLQLQQQQRFARNDTEESGVGVRDSMRRGVAPSKGGTSVSSGTGIFVDGAKDQEGVYQCCSAASSQLEVFVLVGNHVQMAAHRRSW